MVSRALRLYADLANKGVVAGFEARATMKSADEVLQRKELEIKRVKKEIEALRVAAQLLRDKEDPAPVTPRKTAKILRMR